MQLQVQHEIFTFTKEHLLKCSNPGQKTKELTLFFYANYTLNNQTKQTNKQTTAEKNTKQKKCTNICWLVIIAKKRSHAALCFQLMLLQLLSQAKLPLFKAACRRCVSIITL